MCMPPVIPLAPANSPASATPNTPPVCRNVLTTPEAVPTRAGGTAASTAATVTTPADMGMPVPSRTSAHP